MKYQLIIQFREILDKNFDDLIELEEHLIKRISNDHDIDGHDYGNDEFNIFMFTNDAETALEQIKTILSAATTNSFIVAYREVEKEEYKVIWPKDYNGRFAIL